ncbi:dihydrodipicolinate synthase family protein [Bradyrhizobium sp. Leo170]|uniref:dihydrodipicolinate synthase family protein n=1 Tax=Bradyrhizobium sp. Leo170 TaxID=1571199 RepID=UPI0013EEBFB3|nr:dihydrodipicolinate synthase family protein [Bradyrhizobium sp. Leo170]
MAKELFQGVLAFPVTPFDESGERIDLRSYERLLNHVIEGGVHAVIPLGSTGEFAYLSTPERQQLAEATVSITKGRIPAVIGISAITTKETIGLAEHAEASRADGVMISIPTYYALGADEVVAHVEKVARSVKLPVMLYNNPFTSQVDLTGDTIARMVHIENLVAIKEATMDVNRISLLKSRFGNRFEVLGGGFDPYAFPAFCLGVRGWTTGMANIVPSRCVALHRTVVVESNLVEGRKQHEKLLPLANLLVELGLSKAVKAALHVLGLSVGPARNPLGRLSVENEKRLAAVLVDLGVL